MSEEQTTGEPGKYDIRIESAQGAVVGDHNVVYQTIVQGIASLPTDYSARI